jgi:hypothetical protein
MIRFTALTCDDGSPSASGAGSLENRYRCKPVVGSNPTPSAPDLPFCALARNLHLVDRLASRQHGADNFGPPTRSGRR